MADPQFVALYLEPWQQRMFRDFARLGGVKHKLEPKLYKLLLKPIALQIDFKKPVHLNSYRVQFGQWEDEGVDVYLTDAQRAVVLASTGLRADSIRVTTAMLTENQILVK